MSNNIHPFLVKNQGQNSEAAFNYSIFVLRVRQTLIKLGYVDNFKIPFFFFEKKKKP